MSTDKKESGVVLLESLNQVDTDLFNIPVETEKEDDKLQEPGKNQDDSSLKENIVTEEVVEEVEVKPNSEKQHNEASKLTETSNNYHQLLKQLFGEEVSTIIVEKEGEEVEMAIEDVELDKEMFSEIVRNKMALDIENASKDKVDIKGVSDLTKSIIEIDKKGGKVSDLVELRDAYVDPLAALDMDTEQGQSEAIRMRMLAAGQEEEVIEPYIESCRQKGVLREKGEEAKTLLEGRVLEIAEAREKEIADNADKNKELFKVYKKSFKDAVDSSFELNDNYKRRLIDFTTKANEKGNFALEEAFATLRRDPEKSAALALFIFDKEEYDKQTNKGIVREKTVETAEKIGVIRVQGSKGTETSKETTRESRFTSLEDLNR